MTQTAAPSIIVDGPPSGGIGDPTLGGLAEIWHEAVSGAIDPKDHTDRGETTSDPLTQRRQSESALVHDPAAARRRAAGNDRKPPRASASRDFGAAHELRDQDRHPAMHQTQTLDIICLISGDASLVLDNTETRIKPGQIVIQRGTSHGWTAHGGPALFLAVLIDRH